MKQQRKRSPTRPRCPTAEGLEQTEQISRIILTVLRQASEPLTTRDIALQLLVERALDKNDLLLLRLMTRRVGVALRGQKENGIVQRNQGPGQSMLWGISTRGS